MGKYFVEYQEGLSPAPNHPRSISHYLLEQTKIYIQKQELTKTQEELQIEESIIMDALGHVLNFLNCDKLAYQEDNKLEQDINSQYLITLLLYFFASYSFCSEKQRIYPDELSDRKVAHILADFLNEIVYKNDYERTFTERDLYQEYQYQDYKMNMLMLKAFLSQTSIYYKMLDAGISIDKILKDFLKEEGVDHISKYGNCYYTKEMKELIGATEIEMPENESERILKELDAMAYAYAKLKPRKNSLENPKSKLIPVRIKKMKKR